VVKAQLSVQQRESELARATYQMIACRRSFGVLLFGDSDTDYSLVLPAVSPLPNKDKFAKAFAGAHPELAKYLTPALTATGSSVPFADRILISEVAAIYDQAEFNEGTVALSQRILEAAKESLSLIQFRYLGGEASIYEVTAAQETVLAADLAFVTGEIRSLRLKAQLDSLTERGD
jgi:hypothetical protein